MTTRYHLAPSWYIKQWFNTDGDLALPLLRGKVIVMYAFQMLCPGCIRQSIPQAQQVFEHFSAADVSLIGLHTVFQHHEVMTSAALEVFIHENRIRFPIGVDSASADNAIPLTMEAYKMQGTPTLVMIDRKGYLRLAHFGHLSDLYVGAAIATLIAEETPNKEDEQTIVIDKHLNIHKYS